MNDFCMIKFERWFAERERELSDLFMFNPYNCYEVQDYAPTLSTQCGSTTSSASVLIFKRKTNNKNG